MTCDSLETWPESLVCLLANWKYGNCCMMYSTAAPTLLFPRGCSISQKYNKRQSLFEAWWPIWKPLTSCVLHRAIFQTRTRGFVSTARTQITNGGEIPLHMSAHAQAQSMECILIALLVLRAPNKVRFLLESSYQPWRTPTFHENASVSLRSATGTMSMRGDWWTWKKRLKVPLQSEMCFSSCSYGWVFQLPLRRMIHVQSLALKGCFHIHGRKGLRSLKIWLREAAIRGRFMK